MQHVHFQVGVGVFNCQQISRKITFVIFNIVVKNKLNVVCILMDNDTGHHSSHRVFNKKWSRWPNLRSRRRDIERRTGFNSLANSSFVVVFFLRDLCYICCPS